MRVLVTGAYGFIGSHIIAALQNAGHELVCAVRAISADSRLYGLATIACDMARDVDENIWLPRLVGIDAVVNCAGILREHGANTFDAIHVKAPLALFCACERAGIRRVIQISVLGNGEDGEFVASKHRCDLQLAGLDLDWIALRPSVVYSTRGSFGGTSLLRALAVLPKVVLLPGDGEQKLQPISAENVGASVVTVLARPEATQEIFELVGPEIRTMRDYLLAWRHWFGYGKPRLLRVPNVFARLSAECGEWLGSGPFGMTMWRMLERGNIGAEDAVRKIKTRLGFVPGSLSDAFAKTPSQTQDRWHARMYFLLPILRALIAIVWLVSGLIGLLLSSEKVTAFVTGSIPLPAGVALDLARATGAADVLLGVLLIVRWRPRLVLELMLAMLVGYTVFIGILWPTHWLDPFGGLLKNLPLIAVIGLLLATEERR